MSFLFLQQYPTVRHMRKHLWIYTLTYIINSFVFMNNIYTVLEERNAFPTQLPKVSWQKSLFSVSHITDSW